MIKGINNLLKKHFGDNEQKANTLLGPAVMQKIHSFSQNLQFLSSFANENDKISVFLLLNSEFSDTFSLVLTGHLEIPEVRQTLLTYITTCSNFGLMILNNNDVLSKMIDSLIFCSKLFHPFPSTELFIKFFTATVQKSKASPEFFNLISVFLPILFKSQSFFNKFLSIDGFSLLFTSFYFQPTDSYKDIQEFFLKLLFNQIPIDFFKSNAIHSTLKLFIDTISSPHDVKFNFVPTIIFLMRYISSFSSSHPEIFQIFQDIGGFSTLNQIFLSISPEIVHNFYELFLIDSGISPIVVSAILSLFQDESCSANLRSILVTLLSVRTKNMTETYKRFTASASFSVWIVRPPLISKSGLDCIVNFLKDLEGISNYSIISVMDSLINIVAPPDNEEIPTDDFISLIFRAIAREDITPIQLIEHHFIDFFVEKPTPEQMANYYTKHNIALTLVSKVYKELLSDDQKIPILKKFIKATDFFNDHTDLSTFFSTLFEQRFSPPILSIFLQEIEKPCFFNLMISELQKRRLGFDYFLEVNGFSILDQKKNVPTIYEFLSALTSFSPHPQIDNWIHSLSSDDRAFLFNKSNTPSLQAVALGPNSEVKGYILFVPSFLPFLTPKFSSYSSPSQANDFESKSSLNCFLAGKYGIDQCLKMGIELSDIPHIEEIANVFIKPDIAHQLFESYLEHFANLININYPRFSLYEFVPTTGPAFMKSCNDHQINFISFWLRIIHPPQKPINILKIGIASLQINHESVILTNDKERFAVYAPVNQWHHIVLNVQTKRLISKTIDIIFNKQRINSYDLNINDQPIFYGFGDEKITLPYQCRYQISKAFFFNSIPLNDEQIDLLFKAGPQFDYHFNNSYDYQYQFLNSLLIQTSNYRSNLIKTDSVFEVPYLGFASYFTTPTQIESVFLLLERVNVYSHLESIFNGLINLQKINKLNLRKFWNRMLISLKKQANLIESNDHENLTTLLFEIPSKNFSTISFSKSVHYILSDIEIYFIFQPESIIHYLKTILNPSSTVQLDWEHLEETSLLKTLLTIIRTGIQTEISLALIPFIKNLLLSNFAQKRNVPESSNINDPLNLDVQITDSNLVNLSPLKKGGDINSKNLSKLKMFFNVATSISDWNPNLPYSTNDFPASLIMHMTINESKLQDEMFKCFHIAAINIPELQIASFQQLLEFMLYFKEQKGLDFAQLISVYSSKDPKYVSISNLACVAFSSYILYPKIWSIALDILAGLPPVSRSDLNNNSDKNDSETFQSSNSLVNRYINEQGDFQFAIKRSNFISVILEMLICLAQEVVHLSYEKKDYSQICKTLKEILSLFTNLPISQFTIFVQKSYIPLLFNLANLGVCPRSYAAGINEERIENDWTKFTTTYPTEEDLSAIYSLLDDSPFSPSSVISISEIEPKPFNLPEREFFPFDSGDCRWMIDVLDKSGIIEFLTHVALSCDNTLLFDLACGQSLMYSSYSREFGQKLIMFALSMAIDNPIPYPKSLLSSFHQAVSISLLSDIFLDALTSFLKFLHSLEQRNVYESLISDQHIISKIRDIILASFVFTTKGEADNLFATFSANASIIFTKVIFSNSSFALFFIHLSRKLIEGLTDTANYYTCYSSTLSSCTENLTASYNPTDIESKWSSHLATIIHTLPQDAINERNKRSEMIIQLKQKHESIKQKHSTITEVYRAANLFVQLNSQIYFLNQLIRNNERASYEYSLLDLTVHLQNEIPTIHCEKDINKKICPSYHLNPLVFPYECPKVVSPSPWSIKSPSFNVKTPPSFFALSIEPSLIKSPIKEISNIGELICCPEWCFFANTSIAKIYSETESQIPNQEPNLSVSVKINNDKEEREDFINENKTNEKNSDPNSLSSNQNFSPFRYSYLIPQNPTILYRLFCQTFREYGIIEQSFSVHFLYYIHTFPSVLFLSDSTAFLLILAKSSNQELELIPQPKFPVAFMPFSEAVSLGEYGHSSLFCGHIVLIFTLDSIIEMNNYLYIHQDRALCLYPLGSAPLIIVFPDPLKRSGDKSPNLLFKKDKGKSLDRKAVKKLIKERPMRISSLLPYRSSFLFQIESIENAQKWWKSGLLNNYDYLLILNAFSGRNFCDLSQYPVMPWVCSPNLEDRNLSLPMGQLGKVRAEHYDQIFEMSNPQYYYGFHYSLPGAVFWFMMRMNPFTFFQFDLNSGWDDSLRLFTSLNDAFNSAAGANPSDLKELIPQMYCVPESLLNLSRLAIPVPDVILPEWTNNNPYIFTSIFMEKLNNANIEDWIDLIFGFKETGDAAIEAKNVFLPSSYHSATPAKLEMENDVFESHVVNFGQCPIQLFEKQKHPPKLKFFFREPSNLSEGISILDPDSQNLSKSTPKKADKTDNDNTENKGEKDQKEDKIETPERRKPEHTLRTKMESPVTKTGSMSKLDNMFNFQTLAKQQVVLKKRELPKKRIICPLPPKGFLAIICYRDEEIVELRDAQGHRQILLQGAEYGFVRNISTTTDGLFFAISFETGKVEVWQLIYKDSIPIGISFYSSFFYGKECQRSALLPHDYLCASLYNRLIIIWNIATKMRHREIQLQFMPISIIFDQFDGTLTVIGPQNIIQFSENGVFLRQTTIQDLLKSSINEECDHLIQIKCTGIIGISPRFEDRAIVMGLNNGHIIFVMPEINEEYSTNLRIMADITVFEKTVVGMFVDDERGKVRISDEDGNEKEIEVDKFNDSTILQKCAFCGKIALTKCPQCKKTICEKCKHRGTEVCEECAQNLDFSTFPNL